MEENKQKDASEKIQSGKIEHSFKNIEARKVILPDDYRFFKKNFLQKLFCFFLVRICVFTIKTFYARIFMGLKIKGKKNKRLVKKKGVVVVVNHVHPVDSFILVGNFLPRKMFVTSLQSNLGIPFFGKIMEICGAVPIPEKRNQYPRFLEEMKWALEKRKKILVYPEGALNLYSDKIHPFAKGAVRFAIENETEILPCCFTWRKSGPIRRIYRKKPLITLTYLPPYNIKPQETKVDTVILTTMELYDILNDHFQKHNTF